MKEITEKILLKDAAPWYLQIVSRYEHHPIESRASESVADGVL